MHGRELFRLGDVLNDRCVFRMLGIELTGAGAEGWPT
jgi:hypothetical protein